MDLNEVRIIGTVIKDPEVTTTKSGYTVYTFVIAYDINKQVAGNWTKQSTYYEVKQINSPNCTIPCKAVKGAKFLIVGKIAQQQWEKDGKKRIKNYILAETMFEIRKKSTTSQATATPTNPTNPTPADVANQIFTAPPPPTETENFDEIPF